MAILLPILLDNLYVNHREVLLSNLNNSLPSSPRDTLRPNPATNHWGNLPINREAILLFNQQADQLPLRLRNPPACRLIDLIASHPNSPALNRRIVLPFTHQPIRVPNLEEDHQSNP